MSITANYIITESDYKSLITITEPIIKEIGKIATCAGINVFIVGGYVRDWLLGRQRSDFDFTVEGDCFEFAEIVAKHFRSKAVFYRRFRTAMVPVGEYKCEFVGTRKEEYTPESRNPKVTEGTLYEDIRRRDFTINTLAAKITGNGESKILDIFGGIDDLERKLIRTPLDPVITFSEDPLRIMRAARFATQLNFTLDEKLIESAQSISDRIRIISMERVSDELLKILNSPKPSIGFDLLLQMQILDKIWPELATLKGDEKRTVNGIEYKHKDIFRHTLKVVDKVSAISGNTWLRFAALIHDIAKPQTKHFSPVIGWSFHGHEEIGARKVPDIFRRFKLPFEYIPYVEKLVRLHQRPMALVDNTITDSAIRRLAFLAGDALDDLFTLCRADITTNNPMLTEKYLNNYEIVRAKILEVQDKDKLREFQSPVRGEEIMEICNIPPSITVGLLKSAIEEAILDGIIPNEYDAAKQYFLANKDKWIKEIDNGERHK